MGPQPPSGCCGALEQLRSPRQKRRRPSQLLSHVIRHRMLTTRKSENQDDAGEGGGVFDEHCEIVMSNGF